MLVHAQLKLFLNLFLYEQLVSYIKKEIISKCAEAQTCKSNLGNWVGSGWRESRGHTEVWNTMVSGLDAIVQEMESQKFLILYSLLNTDIRYNIFLL